MKFYDDITAAAGHLSTLDLRKLMLKSVPATTGVTCFEIWIDGVRVVLTVP